MEKESILLSDWVRSDLRTIKLIIREFNKKKKFEKINGFSSAYDYLSDFALKNGIVSKYGNVPSAGSISLAVHNIKKQNKRRK